LKPTAITKIFLKLRRKGEAFLFKPFPELIVFRCGFADGNILLNLLIVTIDDNCKKKIHQKHSLASHL